MRYGHGYRDHGNRAPSARELEVIAAQSAERLTPLGAERLILRWLRGDA
jgi:hypothetical protein